MTLADLVSRWKAGVGDVLASDHGVVPAIMLSMVWVVSGGWVVGGALTLVSTPAAGGVVGYVAVSALLVLISLTLMRAMARVVEIRWDGTGLRCSDGQVVTEGDVDRIEVRGRQALVYLRDRRRRVQIVRGVVILRMPRP